MKHNKELMAYQKMLKVIFEMNEGNVGFVGIHKIPVVKFLKVFNKHWSKYYAKEFRKETN